MDDILEIAEMLTDDERTYTLGERLKRIRMKEITQGESPCSCDRDGLCFDSLPHVPRHAKL